MLFSFSRPGIIKGYNDEREIQNIFSNSKPHDVFRL